MRIATIIGMFSWVTGAALLAAGCGGGDANGGTPATNGVAADAGGADVAQGTWTDPSTDPRKKDDHDVSRLDVAARGEAAAKLGIAWWEIGTIPDGPRLTRDLELRPPRPDRSGMVAYGHRADGTTVVEGRFVVDTNAVRDLPSQNLTAGRAAQMFDTLSFAWTEAAGAGAVPEPMSDDLQRSLWASVAETMAVSRPPDRAPKVEDYSYSGWTDCSYAQALMAAAFAATANDCVPCAVEAAAAIAEGGANVIVDALATRDCLVCAGGLATAVGTALTVPCCFNLPTCSCARSSGGDQNGPSQPFLRYKWDGYGLHYRCESCPDGSKYDPGSQKCQCTGPDKPILVESVYAKPDPLAPNNPGIAKCRSNRVCVDVDMEWHGNTYYYGKPTPLASTNPQRSQFGIGIWEELPQLQQPDIEHLCGDTYDGWLSCGDQTEIGYKQSDDHDGLYAADDSGWNAKDPYQRYRSDVDTLPILPGWSEEHWGYSDTGERIDGSVHASQECAPYWCDAPPDGCGKAHDVGPLK